MPLPRLEIFTSNDAEPAASDVIVTDLADFETIKLNSYEQGYLAGWEDGAAAQREGQESAAQELQDNLRNLSFTWEEARSHILSGLEPLLTEMTRVLLPAVAQDSLALWIAAELLHPAAARANGPPLLHHAPDDKARLDALLAALPQPPFTLKEDPSLAAGQLRLELMEGGQKRETQIDLAQSLAAIQRIMRDYFTSLWEIKDG